MLMIAPGNYPLDSLYALSDRVGRPLTWTATRDRPCRVKYRTRADFHSERYETGADVWPQVTPRPIVFQVAVSAPFPLNVGPRFAALVGRLPTDRLAAYSDAEWRRAARRGARHVHRPTASALEHLHSRRIASSIQIWSGET